VFRVFKTPTRKGQNGHFRNVQKHGSQNLSSILAFGHFKRNIFGGFVFETLFGGCPESKLYNLLILNGIFLASLSLKHKWPSHWI
jgi:hypothetical protein